MNKLLVNPGVFFVGNVFISRKSVASCDECDEEDGLKTSVVYKIGQSKYYLSFLIELSNMVSLVSEVRTCAPLQVISVT